MHKCLYGLKQAGSEWHTKFDGLVTKFGLVASTVDSCVYHYRKDGVDLNLCLWVDDGLLVRNAAQLVSDLFSSSQPQTHFEIKPKIVDRFVGLHITPDRPNRKSYVSQPSYVANLLFTFNMQTCDAVSTPADSNSRLTVSQHPLNSFTKYTYRTAVGALIHLCVTRLTLILLLAKWPNISPRQIQH